MDVDSTGLHLCSRRGEGGHVGEELEHHWSPKEKKEGERRQPGSLWSVALCPVSPKLVES